MDNDTITYSNFLKATASRSIINRKRDLQIHVSCKMLQNTWVNTVYVTNDTIDIENTQYGNFDVNISFYTSSSFLYPVTSSPYYVDLNQNLYQILIMKVYKPPGAPGWGRGGRAEAAPGPREVSQRRKPGSGGPR